MDASTDQSQVLVTVSLKSTSYVLYSKYILVTKILFKNISDVGMEKEQKQELGWRVSVLPIPAFHCTLCTCNT